MKKSLIYLSLILGISVIAVLVAQSSFAAGITKTCTCYDTEDAASYCAEESEYVSYEVVKDSNKCNYNSCDAKIKVKCRDLEETDLRYAFYYQTYTSTDTNCEDCKTYMEEPFIPPSGGVN